jgi:hypothetical protein
MMKHMERQYAAKILLENTNTARELFEGCSVRMEVTESDLFTLDLSVDGRRLALFCGDNAVEVCDAFATFLVHLNTRPINE